MMYYGGAGWLGWIWMGFLMIAFWAVVITLVVWAMRVLLWSAYQLFPTLPGREVFNDLAIGLFVLDVALVLSSRPRRDDWL